MTLDPDKLYGLLFFVEDIQREVCFQRKRSLSHHQLFILKTAFKDQTKMSMKRGAHDQVALFQGNNTKRSRNELVEAGIKTIQSLGPERTSSLTSPIMQLTGHEGEVYSCCFHPKGECIASGGYDRQLYLWNTYGECENLAALHGHKSAILDVEFSSDGSLVFTASADKTINVWDFETCVRLKKLKGHGSVVNACAAAKGSDDPREPNLLCSVSDDCTLKLWDMRTKKEVGSFKDTYQLLSCTFNESSNQVIFGGIENVVKVFDLRGNNISMELVAHMDSVTGLSLSPDGSHVLSNSMDNTLCIWDIRPFAPKDRCVKTLHGHQHNFEKHLLRCSWSPDGNRVTAGSADRHVYIWDVPTKRILYKLPGHHGSVNQVVFHPKEPIILSCSSDKSLFLGEIELA